MEVFPNVHCIKSVYRNRVFCQYLLIGEKAVLVDSGFAFTPKRAILPYLENLGFRIERLQWLINTHASADHHGGNRAIIKRAPQSKIIAHEYDAPLIANHKTFLKVNKASITDYGLQRPLINANDPEFIAHHGRETPVDISVKGGEIIQVDDGWKVMLVFTPGHTPGHLSIYDEKHEAIYLGDALLGSGVPDVNGHLVMPPHYYEVEWYLESIKNIRSLAPKSLMATHYKPFLGEKAVSDFLDKSAKFVEGCVDAFMHIFKFSKGPLDGEIIKQAIRDIVGIPNAENQYNLLVRAHLNHLMKQNLIKKIVCEGKIEWQLCGENKKSIQ